MNKSELVSAIAEDAQVTKKLAETVLDSMLDVIVKTVTKKEKVQLVGFGSFEAKHRAGRAGRNPKTGEDLQIPAKTVPSFSPGKAFEEEVASANA